MLKVGCAAAETRETGDERSGLMRIVLLIIGIEVINLGLKIGIGKI